MSFIKEELETRRKTVNHFGRRGGGGGGGGGCGGDGKGKRSGCFKCGKPGHFARGCRNKKPKGDDKTSNDGDADHFSFMAVRSEPFAALDGKTLWIVDSGSSDHVVNDMSLLHDAVEEVSHATIPNGESLSITARGTVHMVSNGTRVTLNDVAFAAELPKNLLSVGQLLKRA